MGRYSRKSLSQHYCSVVKTTACRYVRGGIEVDAREGSAYFFLHFILAQQYLSEPDGGPQFFLAREAEFTCDQTIGDSADGLLKFSDGTEAPIRFRLVDGNWKIDAVLTPDTSLLLAPQKSPDADSEEAKSPSLSQ